MSLPPAATRALVVTILFAACSGGSELFLPGDGEPARIIVVHGNELSGRVGEPLGDSLVFRVTDAQLRPLQGVRVAFALTAAGPGADVLPDTAETDAAGEAYTRMVLGTTIGAQMGEARVVVPEGTRAPVTEFQVTALSENANGMAALSGDNQTGPVGSTLPLPLVVQVTDAFGNPISGVPISWSAEGAGSVSETSSFTDGEGKASVQRTLGPTAGPQVTLAVSEGLAGSPVTFAHTAIAGSASGLSLISGNNQTGQAGSRLPADLVVRLVDEIGNGVPGAAVTWVVGTGGGSVTPENGTTDPAGYASAQYTLGPTPGQNRVDAVVSGVGVVNFTATGTVAAPASLTIVVQPSTTARNGQPLARQPVIQVRDAGGGNAATPGIAITAQLSGGSGELQGTRQRLTDASGRATFTDLAIVGAEGTRVLVFTAPGFGGATSTSIEVSAAPTSTTITSDSPDPSTAGTVVTVGFRVEASGVIPSGTVTVTDGVQSCSGTLSGGSGSCQLALSTVGQRTLRATYSGAAGLSGSSATESHQVSAPPAGNDPPDADYNWHCEGLTCAFTDASSDRDGNVVGWNWNFGDGTTTTTREPTHSYRAAGTYTVILIATDDDGASDQSSATVRVTAPPPPPPAATTTTITEDSPDPSPQGGEITVRFNVTAQSGTPTGTVTVSDGNGGGCTGSAPSGSCTYIPNGNGSRTITARYPGNSNFAPSSGTASHTVTGPPPPEPSPTTIAITSDEPDPSIRGEGVQVRFTVSSSGGTPSGQVTVSDASDTCSGTLDGSGSGSCTLTMNAVGQRTISASYAGNSNFSPSSTGTPHQVNEPPPQNEEPNADYNWNCDGLTCQFTDASDDDDGQVTSWSWDFGDGSSSPQQSPSHTYAQPGNYEVTLRVTDDDGATDESTATVQVNEPQNQEPTAAFNPPSNCVVNQPCQFTDASADSDGNVVGWAWDFGDQGATSNQQNPEHTFSESRSFTVKLRVTDNDGGTSDEVQHEVSVAEPPNEPPTAQIGSISCTGMHCEYRDESTDPNGAETIEAYSWVFGDGESSNAPNTSHDYAAAGEYRVTLTVTDKGGLSDAAETTVSVDAPPDTTAGTGSLISQGK